MEILAVIPIRGTYLDMNLEPSIKLNNQPLIAYTLEAARKSKLINRMVVSTDSAEIARASQQLGADAPFIRPEKYAQRYSTLGMVLKHAVEWLEEKQNYHPEIVVLLEVGYPFRRAEIIDNVISTLVDKDYDSVFVGVKNSDNYWKVDEIGELTFLTEEIDTPREYKHCFYREARGMALATKTDFIRRGDLRGSKIGMLPVEEGIDTFRIINPFDLKMAELISQNLGRLK